MSNARNDEEYLFCIIDDRPDRKTPIITSDVYIKSYENEEEPNDVIKDWLKTYCGLCCMALCIYTISFICALTIPGSIAYGGYLLVLESRLEQNARTEGWMIFGAVIVFIVASCACVIFGIAWIGTFGHKNDLGRNISGIETEWDICIKKIKGVYRDPYYNTEWHYLSKRRRLDYYLGYYSRL